LEEYALLFYKIKIVVRQYKRDEFVESMRSFSRRIRKEKDGLGYRVYRDSEKENTFIEIVHAYRRCWIIHASEEAAFIYPHIIEEHHDTSNETNFLSRRCGANGGFADSTTGDGDRGP
jgi:hypothetical protein